MLPGATHLTFSNGWKNIKTIFQEHENDRKFNLQWPDSLIGKEPHLLTHLRVVCVRFYVCASQRSSRVAPRAQNTCDLALDAKTLLTPDASLTY